MLALIRGAGDIASGAAMRLWRCGIDVVMTDLARPTAIRRTVASAADYEAAQAMAHEFSCPVIAGSLHQGGYVCLQ